MDFDDLLDSLDNQFGEEEGIENPLTTIGLNLNFLSSTVLNVQAQHYLSLAFAKSQLGLLHQDSNAKQVTGSALGFNELSSVRDELEDYDSFTSAREEFLENNQLYNVISDFKDLSYCALQRATKLNLAWAAAFYHLDQKHNTNLELNYIPYAELIKFNDKLANVEVSPKGLQRAESEIRKIIKERNEGLVEDYLRQHLLEDALADLRIKKGLELYVQKNPRFKKLSPEELQDIPADRYKQYFRNIGEKDLNWRQLKDQALRELKSAGTYLIALPSQEEREIKSKYIGQSDRSFHRISDQYEAKQKKLRVGDDGSFKIGQNSYKLLGFYQDGAANELENLLKKCGYTLGTKSDEVSDEIQQALKEKKIFEKVKRGGFLSPERMNLLQCSELLENLSYDFESGPMINPSTFIFALDLSEAELTISLIGTGRSIKNL